MKKVFIGVGITVVVLVALLGAAISFMLKFALRPLNEGKNLESSWEYMFKNYPELETWKDSLQQANALKDTFIYAPDQARLHAYYVAALPQHPKPPLLFTDIPTMLSA